MPMEINKYMWHQEINNDWETERKMMEYGKKDKIESKVAVKEYGKRSVKKE